MSCGCSPKERVTVDASAGIGGNGMVWAVVAFLVFYFVRRKVFK